MQASAHSAVMSGLPEKGTDVKCYHYFWVEIEFLAVAMVKGRCLVSEERVVEWVDSVSMPLSYLANKPFRWYREDYIHYIEYLCRTCTTAPGPKKSIVNYSHFWVSVRHEFDRLCATCVVDYQNVSGLKAYIDFFYNREKYDDTARTFTPSETPAAVLCFVNSLSVRDARCVSHCKKTSDYLVPVSTFSC